MESLSEQTSHVDGRARRLLPTLRDAAFFALVAAYAYAGIDPQLIYHGQSLGFSTMPGWAWQKLAFPDGPTDYVNRLMAQTYNVQWLGALVLTAMAALLALVTHVYFRRLAGRPVPLVRFIPPALLMVYMSFYHEPLSMVFWVAAGVSCAIVYERISRRSKTNQASAQSLSSPFDRPGLQAGCKSSPLPNPSPRPSSFEGCDSSAAGRGRGGVVLGPGLKAGPMTQRQGVRQNSEHILKGELLNLVIFLVMLVPIFYAAYAGVVVFATCAAIIQIARRPRLPLGILYLALAAAVPLATEKWLIPYQPLVKGWFISQFPTVTVVVFLMYLVYPVGTLIVLARSRLARLGRQVTDWLPKFKSDKGSRQPRPGEKQLAAVLAVTFLLLGAGAVAAYARHASAQVRRTLTMDYLCLHEDWAGVLEQAKEMPLEEYSPITCYQVNLALHMLGRMGDDMFAFPQRGVVILGLRVEASPPYMMLLTDMCLRLGRVSDAEHFICETYTMVGNEPRVLELMAKVYLVKGQTAAARKILNVLSHDLTYGRRARERLRQLDSDSELSGDAEIQLYRRRMQRTDDLASISGGNWTSLNVEKVLLDQLQQDPSNRMAFEFLMGMYLEISELDRAANLMQGIKNMSGPGYTLADGSRRTPVAYQEAMAALADRDGGEPKIEGFRIDAETRARMSQMKQIAKQTPDADARMQAMWDNYRHSYFFYLLFHMGDYR